MKASNILIFFLCIAAVSLAHAQQNDTIKTITLKEIIIHPNQTVGEIEAMPDMKENVIYAGKKQKSYSLTEMQT